MMQHPKPVNGYHRPSLNTLLGITQAKKQVKNELGITAVMKPRRNQGGFGGENQLD